MFGFQYYHQTIRKYIIMFGNLFNDIQVQRLTAAGAVQQTIKVPVAYGPKMKFLSRLSQDPNLDRDVAISLPRIGFELQAINYAAERKLTSTTRNVLVLNTDDQKVMKNQYVPVPYDLNITASIFVKNADDGTQILEQILPFFTPEWTTTINVIPSMNIKMDIPTVLQSVTYEDTYDGDFETRRAIVWNLDFNVKGYLYGPVRNTGIINRAFANLFAHTELDNSTKAGFVRTQPGLLANGSPTTNAAASVDYTTISANSDFGFASDIFEFNTGSGANTSSNISKGGF